MLAAADPVVLTFDILSFSLPAVSYLLKSGLTEKVLRAISILSGSLKSSD